MFFLLYLIILCIIYIVSFKQNFNAENIQKVVPVVMAVAVAILLLVVLTSILKAGRA